MSFAQGVDCLVELAGTTTKGSKLKPILLISETMRTAEIVQNWELENLVCVTGFCT